MLLQGCTLFDCDLDLSEQTPLAGVATSEFSLYLRDQNENVRTATDDPLGTDALAAIDITGAAGGELLVFSPLIFVAPDTLLLDGSVVGVPPPQAPGARLRFSAIAPNPASNRVRFAFELPDKGLVRLRIYDIAGRLVAEPLRTTQPAGQNAVEWITHMRSGGSAPAGVYIAELRWGPQTSVRRFVVAR